MLPSSDLFKVDSLPLKVGEKGRVVSLINKGGRVVRSLFKIGEFFESKIRHSQSTLS